MSIQLIGIFLVVVLKMVNYQEDSNLDGNIVFTRLVYASHLLAVEKNDVILDLEEHDQYKWINSLSNLAGESIVPYLRDLID